MTRLEEIKCRRSNFLTFLFQLFDVESTRRTLHFRKYSNSNFLKLRPVGVERADGETYSYIQADMHAFIHSFVRSFFLSFVRSFVRSFIHSFIHTYTHIHTYIYTYIHTHTYTHKHTYIHIYIHT